MIPWRVGSIVDGERRLWLQALGSLVVEPSLELRSPNTLCPLFLKTFLKSMDKIGLERGGGVTGRRSVMQAALVVCQGTDGTLET